MRTKREPTSSKVAFANPPGWLLLLMQLLAVAAILLPLLGSISPYLEGLIPHRRHLFALGLLVTLFAATGHTANFLRGSEKKNAAHRSRNAAGIGLSAALMTTALWAFFVDFAFRRGLDTHSPDGLQAAYDSPFSIGESLFAALAFGGVIFTVILQIRELRESREQQRRLADFQLWSVRLAQLERRRKAIESDAGKNGRPVPLNPLALVLDGEIEHTAELVHGAISALTLVGQDTETKKAQRRAIRRQELLSYFLAAERTQRDDAEDVDRVLRWFTYQNEDPPGNARRKELIKNLYQLGVLAFGEYRHDGDPGELEYDPVSSRLFELKEALYAGHSVVRPIPDPDRLCHLTVLSEAATDDIARREDDPEATALIELLLSAASYHDRRGTTR